MELNIEQLRTINALSVAFCHGTTLDVDIRLPHDAPDGWALVNIIPYYFLVDREGTICHVTERSTPPPGFPNARRVAGPYDSLPPA